MPVCDFVCTKTRGGTWKEEVSLSEWNFVWRRHRKREDDRRRFSEQRSSEVSHDPSDDGLWYPDAQDVAPASRHEACGNKWRRRQQPVPEPWTTMRLQVLLNFFNSGERTRRTFQWRHHLVDSAPWILWNGEGGQTLDSHSISLHIYRFLWVFLWNYSRGRCKF